MHFCLNLEIGGQAYPKVPTNQAPSSSTHEEPTHHVDEPMVHGDPFAHVEHNEDIDPFQEELKKEDAIPVYSGCKIGILSFTVLLLEWKVCGGVTDEAFTSLLQFLIEHLNIVNLPQNIDASKKIVSKFGLVYNRINAYKNNCIIYYKDRAKMNKCSICNTPRYQPGKGKTPWKVLRHFPTTPRILKSLSCPKLAPLFNGYKKARSSDGLWRYPSDSRAWKHIDNVLKFENEETVNIHTGVAIDGINPYKSLSTKWSTWAVTVLNYNLPVELISKPFHMMLALLIPGKKQVQDVDVFLELLIDEYIALWNGIDGVDVSRPIGKSI